MNTSTANKKILITGINGQDGHYLSEILIDKGYKIYGIDVHDECDMSHVDYIKGSIADEKYLEEFIIKIQPDEIYNLASVSQVSKSFEIPEETFKVNSLPVIRILELIRSKFKKTKFLQATSSEVFGGASNPPYNENSAFCPLSPYAVSKEASYHMVKLYRKAYDIFAANAILFNHTSPLHSSNFVIPKIIRGLVDVKLGRINKINLGNIAVERDWGYAGDYVKAMVLIMENSYADDFVVGSGRPISLGYILRYLVNHIDLNYDDVIEIDKNLLRPNDPHSIYSDPSKISYKLGWKPDMQFEKVLDMMIEVELKKLKSPADV